MKIAKLQNDRVISIKEGDYTIDQLEKNEVIVNTDENVLSFKYDHAGQFFYSDEKSVVNAPVVKELKVSPIEFKLLFTALERIQIKSLLETDPVINDLFSIVDDPRLTFVNLSLQSTIDGVNYLKNVGVLTEQRVDEILSGKMI